MSFRSKIEQMPLGKRKLMMWSFIGVIMAGVVIFFVLHWTDRFSDLGGDPSEVGAELSAIVEDVKENSAEMKAAGDEFKLMLDETKQNQEETAVLLQSQYPAASSNEDGFELFLSRVDFYEGATRVYLSVTSPQGPGGAFTLGEVIEQEPGFRNGLSMLYPKRAQQSSTEDSSSFVSAAEYIISYPAADPTKDFYIVTPPFKLENNQQKIFELKVEVDK